MKPIDFSRIADWKAFSLCVIALTAEQVIRGPERKPTLAELMGEGAQVVAGGETVDRQVRLYPIGTAMALAHVLRHATDSISEKGVLYERRVRTQNRWLSM